MFLRQLSSVGSSFLPLPQSQPVLIRAAGYRITASSSSSSYRHHLLPVPPPRPPAVAPPPPPPWWSAQGSRRPPPLPPSHRGPRRSHPVRTGHPYPQLRARDQNVAPPPATHTRSVPPPPRWSSANPLAGSVPRSGFHTSGGLMEGGGGADDRGPRQPPPYKRRRSSEDEKQSRGAAADEEREGRRGDGPPGGGSAGGAVREGGPRDKKGHRQHPRPDPTATAPATGGPRPGPPRRDEEGGRDHKEEQDWETAGRRKNSARRDKEERTDKGKDRTRDGDKNSRHHPSGQKDRATSLPPKDAKSDGAPARPARKSAWSQLWDSQQPPAPRTPRSSEQKPAAPGGHNKPNPWFKKDGAEGVAAGPAGNVPGGRGRGGGPWRHPPPHGAPGPTHTHPDPWFRVPMALQRNWDVLPASRRPPGVTPFEFSVLSYNILSQDLLRDNVYLYRHCHPAVLPWEYRLPNLLAEIRHYDADILCLQEVQEDHYEKQIKPALQEIGYQCEYKKRTGGKPDGCAVVFKASRLSLLSAHPVEYLRPGISVLDRDNVGLVVLLQPNRPQGPYGGGGCGQIRDPSDFICVANTHLLYNPRRGDVKLAQLAVLLAEVSRLSGLPDGSANPVVMCGDFNSTPWSPLYNLLTMGFLEYQGMPIGRVSGQEISPRQQRLLTVPLWPSSLGINTHCQYNRSATQPRRSDTIQQSQSNTTQPNLPGTIQQSQSNTTQPNLPGTIQQSQSNTTQPNLPGTTQQNLPDTTQPNLPGAIQETILDLIANALNINRPHRIDHSVKLRSSYQHILVHDKEFEVTTCHTQTAMTVDYIMYTPADSPLPGGRGLELLGRLSLVGEAELDAVNRLPNQHHSSDHLPLLARFRLH